MVNERGKVVIYAPDSTEPLERFPIDAAELVNHFGYRYEQIAPEEGGNSEGEEGVNADKPPKK